MANKKSNAEEEILVQPSVVEKYGKKLVIGVLALLLVFVGVMCWKQYISAPKELAASDALVTAQKAMAQQDSISVSGVQKAAEAVIDNYSGTDAANLAHLYAGISLYNQGKYQAALDQFEDFDACGDQTVSAMAYAAIADCQACLKQYDDAVKNFKKAADKAESQNIIVMNLIKAGEICEFALNDNAKALECYNKANECKGAYQVQNGQVEEYIVRASNK